jgi:hypothetical protein
MLYGDQAGGVISGYGEHRIASAGKQIYFSSMTGNENPPAVGPSWETAQKTPCDYDDFSPRSSVQLRFLLPGQFCGAGFINPFTRQTPVSSRYRFNLTLSYD